MGPVYALSTLQSFLYKVVSMGPLQLQGLNDQFCMFVVMNVMRQTYISVVLTLAVYFGFQVFTYT